MKRYDKNAQIKTNFSLAKVLIVEDNDDHWVFIQRAMAECLPEVTQIRVATPAQALALFKEWEGQEWELPKLILLDLYLPQNQDGWQLLEQIKMMVPLHQVRIVMLSSSVAEANIMKAYQLGVSAYTVKPVDFSGWLTYFRGLRSYWWETAVLPSVNYIL